MYDKIVRVVNGRCPADIYDEVEIIPSAGVGGLCVGIFSSFARLALCPDFVCLAMC